MSVKSGSDNGGKSLTKARHFPGLGERAQQVKSFICPTHVYQGKLRGLSSYQPGTGLHAILLAHVKEMVYRGYGLLQMTVQGREECVCPGRAHQQPGTARAPFQFLGVSQVLLGTPPLSQLYQSDTHHCRHSR